MEENGGTKEMEESWLMALDILIDGLMGLTSESLYKVLPNPGIREALDSSGQAFLK